MNPKQDIKTPSKTLSKRRIIIGVGLILISAILVLSFISYLGSWKSDQSQAGMLMDKSVKSSNFIGKFGDWLGNLFIFESFGISAFIIAFLIFMLGTLVLKKKYFKPLKAFSHSLFFICWLPIFIGAITKGEGVLSGVYGFQIYDYLSVFIGDFGLWLILITSITLYFVLEFNLRPSVIKAKFDNLNDKATSTLENIKAKTGFQDEENISIENATLDTDVNDLFKEKPTNIASTPKVEILTKKENISFDNINFDLEPQANTEIIATPNKTSETKKENIVEVSLESPQKEEVSNNDDIDFSIEKTAPVEVVESEDIASELVKKHGLYDHRLELAKFQMPSIELLADYGNEEITINKEELEENKNKIVGLLKNFNVGIAQIKATIGPTVTLYEIVPEVGTRVASIKKLQDDIALNLSALGIRIIAPMPGKGTIGIEVPRKNASMVSMRSVIASQKFQTTDMDLPIVFGKTISNEVFMADLAKMPHLLMAGATGQGKSVGINAILASLLYKKHPSELKLVLVDPKKVELSLYSKIERHYLAKLPDTEEAILTDNSKVINTLNSLCIEMDNRYDLLKNAFCRNLKEYNKKFTERKLNPENGHRYLPYIVLVVDEFADLIMTAGKEVEHPIARLAQLARAVGIHLIIATQRPSVNVITGMIKANFPARVSFRVNASVDSRTILDATGADQLVGKGDMLYTNGNDITRVQCAFIDTPEVEKIADFIGEQKGYPDAYELPEYNGEDNGSSSSDFDPNEKDALFEEAARIVVSTQQGSTSMLQRQLKLGYNRAGRIVDQLEASGILGSFNGSKAREVLIQDLTSLEQFLESMKRN
ncbi:FtsK/SpoIIIE family DNA translocase [Riemerella anatipestifer]|uniref:DNA segregation ATPase FtsK/SpoIIIE-related protein n=1 Tax=Riemerella anatipestifer RA-CH-1 TaxID=1228997 RepID=J9QTY4_RIEAN|nr:DNA translocase FtsK [Riemerella anatipestifer]AFR36526.1 DNA segregation ATPase FtsK/SpoIIIE-related protein [Riemerella anatipestifer RA-CH-1]AIH01320.1 cell division protein ftsk/spoiiie [Riemerella anatipestifer CH3]MCO7331439.1 DNA translocase FtsK [Riemerella anatipestifer]MCO7350090.1 DNA translocase FtsK [Riemerella anatipestifer]MCU7582235.1 DNA translocase FtsK [Riemerella anatipestifer]